MCIKVNVLLYILYYIVSYIWHTIELRSTALARCAKTNPKKFYKYINSRTKVRVAISELHTADQRAISDEEDFCVSVFTNEDTKSTSMRDAPSGYPMSGSETDAWVGAWWTTVAKRVKVSRTRSSASESSEGDGRYDYSPIADHLPALTRHRRGFWGMEKGEGHRHLQAGQQ